MSQLRVRASADTGTAADFIPPRATLPKLRETVHPSSVLRAPDEAREEAGREFVADLKRVAAYLEHSSPHRA